MSVPAAYRRTQVDRWGVDKEGGLLGRGGTGRVYRGVDLVTQEWVAVKQIDIAGVERARFQGLVREIKLLQKLAHPNVVRLIDRKQTKSHLYIVLEYAERGSVLGLLRRMVPFPEVYAAVLLRDVAAGLAYLHNEAVLHRDIKCANVLLGSDGGAKLTDFGASWRITTPTEADASVAESLAYGSPHYMAPEVARLETPTEAADMWALGCTIHEMLAGAPPWSEMRPMGVLYHVGHLDESAAPPMPNTCSALLRPLLAACLHAVPQGRPGAHDVRQHPWVAEGVEACAGHGIARGGDPALVVEACRAIPW